MHHPSPLVHRILSECGGFATEFDGLHPDDPPRPGTPIVVESVTAPAEFRSSILTLPPDCASLTLQVENESLVPGVLSISSFTMLVAVKNADVLRSVPPDTATL